MASRTHRGAIRLAAAAIALVALALSGFAAMAYEVLVTRIIALSFGASTYSFSVMLMSFITGIAIGGAIAVGIIGLFEGAVILAVAYELFKAWIAPAAAEAPAESADE